MGSKNVYTAELVEITGIFGVDKVQASLAMTYYFITYSTAQVLLFFFINKINVKWFMLISMFISGIVTVIIAFATSMPQLWWILSINGVLQAGVWGICLAVLNKYLPPHMIPKANTIMNVGMAVAGIVSYGSSALFVAIDRWNLPFIILGAILSLSAVLFFISVHICENAEQIIPFKEEKKETINTTKPPFELTNVKTKAIFIVAAFIFSLLIHFVFYGAMNWIPNLLNENYGLDESLGILISILAPLATTVGPIIAIRHCEKYSDFIKVCLTYLLVATVLSLIMIFVFNVNAIIATAVIVLFLVVIQGAITIIFSVLPFKMGAYVNSGALASLMNAAGGFSAGFAPTIVAAVINGSGWQISYAVLFGICLVTVIALYMILVVISKINRAKQR